VAFDLDGTLAPIVARPERASVPPALGRRLSRAARAPGVTIAVVSARRLADVRRLLPAPGVLRIGQYGLEGPGAPTNIVRARIRRRAKALLARIQVALGSARAASLDFKGMTLAVHDRGLGPARAEALRSALRPALARAGRSGFVPAAGRRVTELVPRGHDKGRALRALRRRAAPSTVFYFGDSDGDEPAFAVLGPADFPVRVGRGRTLAAYRIRGPAEVARFLAALVALRAPRAGSRKGGAPWKGGTG
jgi:trehalose 6-phosphate synthase/phosphatase